MAVISTKIIGLMNLRIQQEELSSRLYKAMAIGLEYNGFSGAAKLWNTYSAEEYSHAQIAYNYLLELDIQPTVPSLPQPQFTFTSLQDVIKKSYEHELVITKQCNDLAIAAQQEGDFMTLQLAQTYLKEQVEELGKTTYWLDRLEAFGDSKESLRLLDNEMGCK